MFDVKCPGFSQLVRIRTLFYNILFGLVIYFLGDYKKLIYSKRFDVFLLNVLILLSLLACSSGGQDSQTVQNGTTPIPEYGTYRVNIPYFEDDIRFSETGIFWFGQVKSTDNYIDVRIGYNEQHLYVRAAVFDRRLWYQETPSADSFTQWDAMTLYLYTGESGNTLNEHAYRMVAQINHWQERDIYQAFYRGIDGEWVTTVFSFLTESGWRGNGFNDDIDDRGWVMTFPVPFTDLGLSGPPEDGTVWRMALEVHDRDDKTGTAIAAKVWPGSSVDTLNPDTWGEIAFGLPLHAPCTNTVQETIMIRNEYDDVMVVDASVGGGSTCGEGLDFWMEWGDAPSEGNTPYVQNQADVADWPCFSKIYLSFPLDSVPPDKEIISATLSMHQFGGSDPAQANPSFVQAITASRNWDKQTITWNNAPLAMENMGGIWVEVIQDFPGWPGVEYEWDVSRGVAQAYKADQPFNLVLYSSDSDYHSGKYFVSSDTDDWNAEGRPTLYVQVGNCPQ